MVSTKKWWTLIEDNALAQDGITGRLPYTNLAEPRLYAGFKAPLALLENLGAGKRSKNACRVSVADLLCGCEL
jgi:hypothetical protein